MVIIFELPPDLVCVVQVESIKLLKIKIDLLWNSNLHYAMFYSDIPFSCKCTVLADAIILTFLQFLIERVS